MIEVAGLWAFGRGAGDAGRFTLGPVDLRVEAGAVAAVVGPAGGGKSLLLSALVGLVPAEGEVSLAGVALGPGALADLRRQVGFAFQRDALLEKATALENVLLAVGPPEGQLDEEERVERARRALARVGLSDAADKRPAALSGGMRRRVGLARALASAAPVLLLDDVTAGLDPSTGAEVLDEVVALARGRPAAVLLTTSDVDTALPRADQVLVLDEGAVVFAGPAAEIAPEGPLAAFAPALEAATC